MYSTTGTPAGCVRAVPIHDGSRPSASMYRTSLAPRRVHTAAVSELQTSVTAAFRTVSRHRP